MRGRRRCGPHLRSGGFPPRRDAAVVIAVCRRGAGFRPWAFEASELVVGYFAADEFVQHDHAHDGKVRSLEEDDACSAKLVVDSGEEEPERPEDHEGKKVEGRVEMRQSVGCRCLEDIDAVNVEVLFAGVGDDAGEGIRQHT